MTRSAFRPRRSSLAVLLLIAAVALFAWWMVGRADRAKRADLLQQTQLVAKAVDVEHVRALSGTEADLNLPDYLRLKEQFGAIRSANQQCRFVYLMGRKADGTVFFFVDDRPVGDKEEAPAGMIYDDVPDGFRQVFDTRQADIEGPYKDQWGTFISGAVPLNDPQTGDVLAVFAMDIDAGTWKWDIAADSALPVGIMLALMIVLATWIAAARSEGKASLKPIRKQLLIPLASALLLLVGGFGVAFLHLEREDLKQFSLGKLAAASYDLKRSLSDQSKLLTAIEEGLVREAALIDALKAQDRDRLLADYEPLFNRLRAEYAITHFYFQRPDRVNLLRMHQPGRAGDLIDRFTTLEAERTRQTASGIELGPLGTFTLRVVRPVFDGDTLIGYLELGKEIEDILEEIAEEHGIELAMSIQKNLLDRTNWEAGMEMLGRKGDWDRFQNDVLPYSSLPLFPPECDRFVNESGHTHKDVTTEAAFNGKSWRVLTNSLFDVSGAEVGDLIILHDISAAKMAFNRHRILSLGGALTLLAALLGFLYVLLRRTDAGIRSQQAELLESNDRFEQLAEQSNTFAWEVDADGLYTYVNHVAHQVIGYRPEELVGRKHFYDLCPEAEREAFKAAALVAFEKMEQFAGFENLIQTKDGSVVCVSTNGLPLLSANGSLLGYRGSDTDITERKRAEAALKEAEQRWRAFTTNTDDIIQVLDTDGTIQYMNKVNPPHTLEDVVGKPVFDFMDPNSAEEAKHAIDVLLDTRKPQQLEIVTSVGDTRMDFSIKYVPDVANGKVNRIIVLVTDVTERKRAEKTLSKAMNEATRMNRLMSGREMRVIELKSETNALLKELGRDARYGSVER